VGFEHYPPADEIAAARLRDATVAWVPLLGELMAAGLRPYLELSHGDREDDLRLYCEPDNQQLLDISLGDEGLPDQPSGEEGRYWLLIVQDEDSYLAEVTIDSAITFRELAMKAVSVLDAVAAGEHPFFEDW
jgi:hypothetical protein